MTNIPLCIVIVYPMQEMLFRRTCKLVELESARRNVEKAKPVKKAAVSVSNHVL